MNAKGPGFNPRPEPSSCGWKPYFWGYIFNFFSFLLLGLGYVNPELRGPVRSTAPFIYVGFVIVMNELDFFSGFLALPESPPL